MAPRGYAPAPAVPEWPPATSQRRRFETDPRYERPTPRYAADPRGGYRDSYPASGDYAASRDYPASRDDYAQSRDYAPPRAPGREAYPASDDYARTPTVPQGPQDDGRWQDEQHYDDMPGGAEQQGHEHGHDAMHVGDPARAG